MMLIVLITISTTLMGWLLISKTKTIKQNNMKNYRTLKTILESTDSIVIIGGKSTSITRSITGIGLDILPTTAGNACILPLGNKVLHKLIILEYIKYRKQNQ